MANHFTSSFGNIYYSDEGKGFSLIFLHGYLETSVVFSSFAGNFIKQYRVVCIDLPGHGKSEDFFGEINIQDYSQVLYELISFLKIESFVLVGHSLGGYIALDFCSLYWKKIKGVVLYHSHPFADNEVKRRLRDREIELIRKGRKNSIIKFSIPLSFSENSRDNYTQKIQDIIDQASSITVNTMIQSLWAMQQRKDRTETIAKLECPVVIVQGIHDEIIDHTKMKEWCKLRSNVELNYLQRSAHFGFIEEEKECVQILSRYLLRLSL